MAKITEHKEDKIGGLFLNIASLTLITLFAITAQVRHSHYYIWALMVSYFYGIAIHERTPRLYKRVRNAGLFYLLFGGLLTASVAFITMVFRNPEQFFEYMIQMP